MYRYETHLHTFPVSKCAKVDVRKCVEFYKSLGYDGIFITNHFIDGNMNRDGLKTYEDCINFFCSDYEEGKRIGEEIGIKVFFGVEMSYKGTDFLVYGLDREWYLAHPEIAEMKKSEELPYLAEHGALIIHAHPFREAAYIDHIRLFPRCVHGVETDNACRKDFENRMAAQYARDYGLFEFAGSDNHVGSERPRLAGIETDTPLEDEADLVRRAKNGELRLFSLNNDLHE